MKVLVFNCGSSSVKFRVASVGAEAGGSTQTLAGGSVQRVGGVGLLDLEGVQGAVHRTEPVPNHGAAIRLILGWLGAEGQLCGPDGIAAVGHRVVHGGERFVRPTLIDASVTFAIDALEHLAPLHNPPGLAGIRAARALLGDRVPMVAVFDTAFHARMPEHAACYAIPQELAVKHGIRRYGFHGISYQYLLDRYAAIATTPPERARLVAFHLGAGCSAAAIAGGSSVDTSMGFTPLEGLVMATRCGDLDPAVPIHLARQERLTPEESERLLNQRSGLLGLSGRSADMRDLIGWAGQDPRARLAVTAFCYRARKYLGAYLAVLGGADAVLFTGGVGEHQPEVRARICEGMEFCGLRLDPDRNAACVGTEGEIGAAGSSIRALVIPTDEESVIARETAACVAARGAGEVGHG